MKGRPCQGLFNRPSMPKSPKDQTRMDASLASPFCESQGSSVVSDPGVIPLVPCLLKASFPSAVLGTVRAVVVNPANAMVRRRSRPHVVVEDSEVIPLRADRDAATAVVGILTIVRIQAARPHTGPDPVLRHCRREPMSRASQAARLALPASTRCRVTGAKRLAYNGARRPAVASAKVLRSTVRGIGIVANDNHATESKPGRYANLCWHRSYPFGEPPAVATVRGHSCVNYTMPDERIVGRYLREKVSSLVERMS